MVIVSEKHARWVTALALCCLAMPAAVAADLDVSADTPDVSSSMRELGEKIAELDTAGRQKFPQVAGLAFQFHGCSQLLRGGCASFV